MRTINFILSTLTGPGGASGPLYKCYRLSFPLSSWPGLGVDYPPPSRAKVKLSTAIPLLPIYICIACYVETFIFNYVSSPEVEADHLLPFGAED